MMLGGGGELGRGRRFTTYQLYDVSKSKSGYHVALCVERKTLIKSALSPRSRDSQFQNVLHEREDKVYFEEAWRI